MYLKDIDLNNLYPSDIRKKLDNEARSLDNDVERKTVNQAISTSKSLSPFALLDNDRS